MKKGLLTTALPLTDAQREAISQKIAQAYGEEVNLDIVLDPSLLGGIRVEVDGCRFDGSLQGQLETLLKTLSQSPANASQSWTDIGRELAARIGVFHPTYSVESTGKTLSCGDGVARLAGLDGCRLGELIAFDTGGYGIALNLEEDQVGVVLLGEEARVSTGTHARGTGRVLSVPVGNAVLGRVLNPLGQPLDDGPRLMPSAYYPIEAPAPEIIDRMGVTRPMETGLIAVDAMVPIGRGQRELIIGDRQTGKTSIAVDTILNQRGKNMACIYVAIGQKASTVAHITETLRMNGALGYTAIVCATASDAATMQYIAPYAGCAMAEYFMKNGRDALIIYDDLSKHAAAYRAMSLLLRRPPGREAYPGDVFYLHSRLLERAAQLSDALGGGSMTALPIIETQAGDISAYIPTNVISITDGQLFLDTDLFRAGVRPAVSGGLSVSRVGGAAQTKAMRTAAGQLRLVLAQFREMQVFAQFSSDMDTATQDLLGYGERLTEILKQRNFAPLDTAVQVAMLYAVTRGLLAHDLPMEKVRAFKREFPALLTGRFPHVIHAIQSEGTLSLEAEKAIRQAYSAWQEETP